MLWTSAMKATALAMAFGAAGSAAAGTIVIRADGPSKAMYPAGKPLGAKVTLARGDTLVILDGRGTRTLNGPGTIDLAARAGAAPSAFTALINNSGSRQVRTGAVRGGATGPVASPSLWYVDTARTGTVCLPDLTRAQLWRSNAAAPVAWTLTRAGSAKPVAMTFAANQNVRSWPVADLSLEEGVDYKLAGSGLASPVTIRFVAIGKPSANPEDVATALIGKGCSGQLDRLVEAGKSGPASVG